MHGDTEVSMAALASKLELHGFLWRNFCSQLQRNGDVNPILLTPMQPKIHASKWVCEGGREEYNFHKMS